MNFITIILMMTNNIDFDQIQTDDTYDLTKLFNNTDDDNINIAPEFSPFSQIDLNCKYHTADQLKTNGLLKKNDLKGLCINIQSINAHWDNFNDLVTNFDTSDLSFDFIGLTKIFKVSENYSHSLNGYHPLQYTTRPGKSDGRGGVGIFINENFSYKKRDDLSIFIPHVIETIFMEIKIKENKSLIIGIIYRPNTAPKADIDIFTKSVFDINNIICNENKEAILLGDFNMDLLKFESHHKSNLLLENMLSQGYLPVITKPTRVTPTTATLIDHIYTNISSPSYKSGILINDVADHFGTFISVSKKVPAPSTKYIKFRSYKPENILAFKQLLGNCDFTTVINHQSANDAYNTFLQLYQAAFDISFPEKIVKTK